MVDPVAKIQEANETVGAEEKMAVDAGPRQFSAKTMQNEHGNFAKSFLISNQCSGSASSFI